MLELHSMMTLHVVIFIPSPEIKASNLTTLALFASQTVRRQGGG
jgi:hypothetical protein